MQEKIDNQKQRFDENYEQLANEYEESKKDGGFIENRNYDLIK